MNKIFKALSLLFVAKFLLDLWGTWSILQLPESMQKGIWGDTAFFGLIYFTLIVLLLKHYRLAIVISLLFYLYHLWLWRDMGFSLFLIFNMGVQAQLQMVVTLASIILCLTGSGLMLKSHFNNKQPG